MWKKAPFNHLRSLLRLVSAVFATLLSLGDDSLGVFHTLLLLFTAYLFHLTLLLFLCRERHPGLWERDRCGSVATDVPGADHHLHHHPLPEEPRAQPQLHRQPHLRHRHLPLLWQPAGKTHTHTGANSGFSGCLGLRQSEI